MKYEVKVCRDCLGRGAYDDPPWGIVHCAKCNGMGFLRFIVPESASTDTKEKT